MIANSACVALKTRQSKKRAKRGRKRPVARRSKTGLRAVSKTAKPSISGAEIRARIAANREKRLRIADAMKREAGVTGHEINTENLAGLAYIGTGRILSPEGRKIVQLYTLAHECGHIFLHNSGPGYWLPGHIKELEAESYAHQAFREHGMTLPRRLSDWGRTYVGSWVEKDRAAGIPIDPRAPLPTQAAGGPRTRRCGWCRRHGRCFAPRRRRPCRASLRRLSLRPGPRQPRRADRGCTGCSAVFPGG